MLRRMGLAEEAGLMAVEAAAVGPLGGRGACGRASWSLRTPDLEGLPEKRRTVNVDTRMQTNKTPICPINGDLPTHD